MLHSPLRRFTPAAFALAALGPALALAACGPSRGPEVVAADGVLCDLTQRLAGSDLQVACLLQPGDDPHQFHLTPQQSQQLKGAQLVLINGYGPTETTIGATLGTGWNLDEKPPLGRPLANVCVYVLNDQLQPLPVGVPGELLVLFRQTLALRAD